jgi:hypothetical protein
MKLDGRGCCERYSGENVIAYGYEEVGVSQYSLYGVVRMGGCYTHSELCMYSKARMTWDE